MNRRRESEGRRRGTGVAGRWGEGARDGRGRPPGGGGRGTGGAGRREGWRATTTAQTATPTRSKRYTRTFGTTAPLAVEMARRTLPEAPCARIASGRRSAPRPSRAAVAESPRSLQRRRFGRALSAKRRHERRVPRGSAPLLPTRGPSSPLADCPPPVLRGRRQTVRRCLATQGARRNATRTDNLGGSPDARSPFGLSSRVGTAAAHATGAAGGSSAWAANQETESLEKPRKCISGRQKKRRAATRSCTRCCPPTCADGVGADRAGAAPCRPAGRTSRPRGRIATPCEVALHARYALPFQLKKKLGGT